MRTAAKSALLLVLLWGGVVAAEQEQRKPQDALRDLQGLQVLALSPEAERVVVGDGAGALHVLAVGDPVPLAPTSEAPEAEPLDPGPLATVLRIEAARLVLLLETDRGPCEVWIDTAVGGGGGRHRMRTVCPTADESSELSKPVIQPLSVSVSPPEEETP